MNAKEVYKVWARPSIWSGWVRPVPFIDVDKDYKPDAILDFTIPEIYYVDSYQQNEAIFIDIDGPSSIKEGIALAQKGYRPIPIFNGTNPLPQSDTNVDNRLLMPYLIYGAEKLKSIAISEDASPVFLLDSNRLNRYRTNRSLFDASWDIYPQDIPSCKFLQSHQISKIIIRGTKVSKDLEKVLYPYQQKGMKIFFTNGFEKPVPIQLKKPRKEEL